MRIDLNLAKHPFRNRSLFWLAMGAGFLVAGSMLLFVLARAATVGADTASLREKTSKQEATIKEIEGKLDELKLAKERAIFADTDRLALDEARTLIVQRSFSWSRLFHDLEGVVPDKVKLTSVAVGSIEGDGPNRVVTIVLTGKGKDYEQMTALLANFDRSGGRFVADPVQNGPDPDSTDFTFTVVVQYRPEIAVAGQASDTVAALEARTDG